MTFSDVISSFSIFSNGAYKNDNKPSFIIPMVSLDILNLGEPWLSAPTMTTLGDTSSLYESVNQNSSNQNLFNDIVNEFSNGEINTFGIILFTGTQNNMALEFSDEILINVSDSSFSSPSISTYYNNIFVNGTAPSIIAHPLNIDYDISLTDSDLSEYIIEDIIFKLNQFDDSNTSNNNLEIQVDIIGQPIPEPGTLNIVFLSSLSIIIIRRRFVL